MKTFFYALRYILKSPSAQFIKVTSLTLGLAAGLLIFAKVAFERSYDNFFPDADRLYQLKGLYPIDDGSGRSEESDMLFGPMAPHMVAHIPEVESATRTFWFHTQEYFHDDHFFDWRTILADTSLFEVLDYGLLQGDIRALSTPDAALVSRTAAIAMFGDDDPIGRTFLYDKRLPLTVRGVFRDVPENSQVDFDIILPLAGMRQITGWVDGSDWGGGDSFRTYLKLRPGASMERVEAAILPLFEQSPLRQIIGDFNIGFRLRPIERSYREEQGRGEIASLMLWLAFLVLFISAMNYVLVCVSSLDRRTKAIAVQKCNGARAGTIFGQLLIETGLLILLSLLLCTFLLAALREPIHLLTGQTLATLFVPAQWLRIGAVVAGFFLLAGVIPGRIFSRIPLTHAFKPLAAGKRWWKQALLFLQLLCATFVLIFLVVVVRQYHLVANRPMGYDYENVVATQIRNVTPAGYARIRQQLSTLPFVEETSMAVYTLTTGLNGLPIEREGQELLSSRQLQVEPGFLEMMGIAIEQGRSFAPVDAPASQVIVNRRLVEMMGWRADEAVGKVLEINWDNAPGLEVIGVAGDFHVGGWASGQLQPVVVLPIQRRDTAQTYHFSGQLHIRLQELNAENTEALHARLQELLPDQKVAIESYIEAIAQTSSDERMIRNIVAIAAGIILLITLTGLIGYINDEVRRRRREIAVRKVHGASVRGIIGRLGRSLRVAAGAALLVGAAGAWIASGAFLRNFPVQITLRVWHFVAGAALVLLICAAVLVLRSWRAANENPSNTLKSE